MCIGISFSKLIEEVIERLKKVISISFTQSPPTGSSDAPLRGLKAVTWVMQALNTHSWWPSLLKGTQVYVVGTCMKWGIAYISNIGATTTTTTCI